MSRSALGPLLVIDAVSGSQVDALERQIVALQNLSQAQVDLHLADATSRVGQHFMRPVRLLLVDRHTGAVQADIARRVECWGCLVQTDLGRGQEHGDSCGYNAAYDAGKFLAHHGEGPWWQPQIIAWQPHQAQLVQIGAANQFLNNPGPSARFLSSEEVLHLVSRDVDQPDGRWRRNFGGALSWDWAFVSLHDAMLQSTRTLQPHESFCWTAVLNTVQSGCRGSHWFSVLVHCPPAMTPQAPPADPGRRGPRTDDMDENS